MRNIAILSLSAFAALAACGDDASGTDTADTVADMTADTGGAETSDAPSDSGDAPDATAACDPGAATSGEQTAEGLVLELCGATLTVPANAVAVGATIGLEVVEPPAPAPFEREFVSPILKVVTATGFSFPGTLLVPDLSAAGGYREGAYYEASGLTWYGFEACPDEGGGVAFTVTSAGTFVLLRDTIIFPDSPQDLGSGTLTATFMTVQDTWTFDDGYAIHDVGSNGLRSVTLIARRTPEGGSLQQLDIRLTETAEHDYAPLQVTLLDTSDLSGGWSWLEPVHGPAASSSIIAVTGDRVVGNMSAVLHKGEDAETITIAVDAQTGRYRFPPEGACMPE